MQKEDRKIIYFIIKLFLFLRVSLLFFAWIGVKILPFKYSFPYTEIVLFPYGSPFLWSWANFDGVHYMRIVEDGYIYGLTQAYFPLYPILIKGISNLIPNLLFSGLFVSHLCFFTCFYLFYKLIRLDFKEDTAKKALFFLFVFPTSLFFLSYYTESLFLTLILGSFYLARKKKWFWSGIVGAFASATRVTGVLIIPALLIEYYQEYKSSGKNPPKAKAFRRIKKKRVNFKSLISCLLPSLGIISYMIYLAKKFSDPILFIHSQSGFGAGRETDKIVLLYQVFWRYIKMVFTVDPHNPIYFPVLLEFGASLLFLGLLFVGIKKVRNSYLVYAFLSFILPTLTGVLSSMPRYVLVLFPCFIILGLIKNKKIFYFLLFTFYFLLGICTILFTRGYWIA